MRLRHILIVMLFFSRTAHSEDLPDGGVSAPEVAAALKHAGYPADITDARSGSPVIRSSTGKFLFFVHFFQCSEQLRCPSIQFAAEFRRKQVTPMILATWNKERRFGRAFLDNHGAAWVAMDVETSHGMTTEALGADIARWIAVAGAFDTFAER